MIDRCRIFPNCIKLVKKLNIPVKTLYNYIRNYNDYAARHEDEGLKTISQTTNYTEEELDDIAKRIIDYRDKLNNDQRFAISEIKSLKDKFGSYESYAQSVIRDSGLTGEEIEDLRNEIAYLFNSVIEETINSDEYFADMSMEDIIKTYSPAFFLDIVKSRIIDRVANLSSIINNEELLKNYSEEDIESMKNAIILAKKILIVDKDTDYNNVFNELCILSIPLINSIYGIKIQSDFSVSQQDAKIYAEIVDVADREEPQTEHWNSALERKPPEGSVSEIIRRILLNTQRVRIEKKTTFLLDGKELSEERLNNLTDEETNNLQRRVDINRIPINTIIMGTPMFNDPSQEARRLFRILQNCTSESEMMSVLSQQEQYRQLYDYLDSHDRERTTFFADFYKYFQPMIGLTITDKGDGTFSINVPRLNSGRRNDRLNTYYSNLYNGRTSQNSIFKSLNSNNSKRNKVTIDKAKYKSAKEWFKINFIDRLEDKRHTFIEKDENGNDKEVYVTEYERLRRIGAHDEATNLLIAALDQLNIDVDLVTANDIESSDFSSGDVVSNLEMFYMFLSNNFSSQNIINTIDNNKDWKGVLDNILKYTEVVDIMSTSSVGLVDFAGSKVADRLLPSAITNFIKKIKASDKSALTSFLNNIYLDSKQFKINDVILNRWLSDFIDCADDIPNGNSIKNNFALSRNLGVGSTKFEQIADRPHMLSFLFSYFGERNYSSSILQVEERNGEYYQYNSNTGKYDILLTPDNRRNKIAYIVNTSRAAAFDRKGFKKDEYRKDYAMIPLFITGDTNQLRLFKTLHYYEDEILDGMYNFYLSDLINQDVITQLDKDGIVVSSNGKETMTKGTNATKFGLLQFLNKKEWRDKLNSITPNDGVVLKDNFKALAKEYLESSFNNEFLKQLKELGVLDTAEDGKYVYFDDFLTNQGIPNESKEVALMSYLQDFYFNYKFGLYNQTHIQHVTPLAFGGVEEHQKRNKVGATNGTSLSRDASIAGQRLFNPGEFSQKVVYFKDVFASADERTETNFANFIRETYTPIYGKKEADDRAKQFIKTFKNCSLTDGEAYRSLDSYRRILGSAGKNFWSDKQEEAYQRIKELTGKIKEENRNATIEEIQEIEDFLVTMQPIKPVNDGIETRVIGNAVTKFSFQFKYAEVPLIPEMYPIGSKLRQMGQWMDDNGIDMMCSDKCLKKGSFGEIDIQFKTQNGVYLTSDGKNICPGYDMNNNLVDNPTAAQQRRYIEVTGKDLRVPIDDNTSFEDIINGNSRFDDDGNNIGFVIHDIPLDNYLIQSNVPDHSSGNVIVGTQMRKLIGSKINPKLSYKVHINGQDKIISGDKLLKIYNLLHSAKYFKSYEKFIDMINDPQQLSRNLSYNINTNGRSNLALLERIALDDNGEPLIPYSEISNQGDLLNAIIGLFKRTVIRQEISGGNIVQASSLGCGDKALRSPDLYEIFDEDGTFVGVEAEMPFFFTVVGDDGIKVNLKYEDYCFDDGTFKPGTNGTGTLIEERFPGILDIEAYRIPTEGGYSMYHIHIKRVTPKTSANTIKLPAICTKISDFDFDIDKLMFMCRTFRMRNEKVNKETADSEIWNNIYDDYPDIRMKLHAARGDGDVKVQGVKPASKKEKAALAAEKGVSVEDLSLNHYWELAGIEEDKQELYKEYAENYISENSDNVKYVGSTYDFESSDPKDIMSLSLNAIDNAIVDITETILSDRSTMEDRITPGGFPWMKDDARIIRLITHKNEIDEIRDIDDINKLIAYCKEHDKLDYKENRDYSDPYTSIVFKQQNQIAGEEIGIFANDNVNDAISRTMQTLRIKDPKNAILFGSLINQEANIDGVTTKNVMLGRNFLFNSVNGRNISKALHELLGSSVDAVKDNALIDINLNAITGDLGAMLVRLGYSTFDVGILFNQPVIKQLCQEMALTGEKNIAKALNRVIKANGYSNSSKPLRGNIAMNKVTTENLVKNLIVNSYNVDKDTQLQVARLFYKIAKVKQELSDYIQQTRNTSANTVKVDIGKYISNARKIQKRKNKGFELIDIVTSNDIGYPITDEAEAKEQHWGHKSPKEMRGLINEFLNKYQNHPFLYENAVYNIINGSMDLIMSKFTPFVSIDYSNYREKLEQYIAPWGVAGEQINQLHRFIPALKLLKMNGDFNPNAMNNPLHITNKDYYLKKIFDLAAEIEEDQRSNVSDLENNKFLTKMLDIVDITPNRAEEEEHLYMFRFKNTSFNISQWEKYGITMDWDAIAKKGGKYLEFAKAIYLHFYYINGLNPDVNPLMSYAPTSVLDSLVADCTEDGTVVTKYLDIYNEDNNEKEPIENISANIIKFLITFSKDEKLVPVINWKRTGKEDSIIATGDMITDVTMSQISKDEICVRPIIRVNGALYVLATNNGSTYKIGTEINNVISTATKSIVYVRLNVEQTDDFRDYAAYFQAGNGYIFGDFRDTVDVVYSENEEDDIITEDIDTDSTSNSKEAADAASKESATADSKGLLPC